MDREMEKVRCAIRGISKNPIIWDANHPDRNDQELMQYTIRVMDMEAYYTSRVGLKSPDIFAVLERSREVYTRLRGGPLVGEHSFEWIMNNFELFYSEYLRN